MVSKKYKDLKYALVFLVLLLIFIAGCNSIPDAIGSAVNPVINTFVAEPSSINDGEITELRWNTSNAQSVQIDNGIGDVSLSGTIPVSPSVTSIYTLTARNPLGTSIARTQIIVRVSESSQSDNMASLVPLITKFDSSRDSIFRGEYSILNWNVINAEEVILTSVGNVENNGEKIIYPENTTTYTLSAINPAGSATANVTVTVLNPLSERPSNTVKSFYALPGESGSLVKRSEFLDYQKKTGVCAGDTSTNFASRAFLSFDISSIPSNAIIEEAILDLSRYNKIGDPTYVRSLWGNMGALEVYYLQYGGFNNLDFSDYDRSAKVTENGVFTEYPLSPWAWDIKNSDDGTTVIQDLVQSGATRCQFRIQFFTSTNWDGVSDMICFDNAILTIKYSIP